MSGAKTLAYVVAGGVAVHVITRYMDAQAKTSATKSNQAGAGYDAYSGSALGGGYSATPFTDNVWMTEQDYMLHEQEMGLTWGQ